MKILIISDSHGVDRNVKKAIERERPFDVLLHLGDSQASESHMQQLAGCPVYMVAGNCDYFTDLPSVLVTEFGKNRVMLTHGHYHFVSLGVEELVSDARANGCNIVIYGHTHVPANIPVIDEEGSKVLVLNPGSLTYPRQEGRRPTYMVMELTDEKEPDVWLKYL